MTEQERDGSLPVEEPVHKDHEPGLSQVRPDRLEALLVDDQETSHPVNGITAREVRAVGPFKSGSSILLFLLLALGIFLLGSGYYFFHQQQISEPYETLSLTTTDPKLPIPERPAAAETPRRPRAEVVSVTTSEPDSNPATAQTITEPAPAQNYNATAGIGLYSVLVGPFINGEELEAANRQLGELGFRPQMQSGHGKVTMLRLLDGVYQVEEGRKRLAALRQYVDSAFLLAEGEKLAVYAGSFHNQDRANVLRDDLAGKGIKVRIVSSEISMDGTMLVAIQADQQTAKQVAEHISKFGMHVQITEKK